MWLAACGSAPRDSVQRCSLCGMDAGASGGRFVLDFEDGTTMQACSAGCAVKFKARHGSPLYRVRALAHDTGKLVDGSRAVFVLGADSLPAGSMPPSVFAFASKQQADAFVSEHGGELLVLQALFDRLERP
jgi:hypothetical protein